MKTTVSMLALAVTAFVLNSCVVGTAPTGALYTDVTDPVTATSTSGSRMGVATATSYLGLVAMGDASIAAAKANGGISSVSSVDKKRTSILGIINTYTTTVKGN